MKFKILALLLCACLLIAVLAGCGIKLSPDTGASPGASASSSSPGSSADGDSSDVTTLIGVVDSLAAGTVILKVTEPYDNSSSGTSQTTTPGLVGSGSYMYTQTGETQTFTLTSGTIVILEDKGYVPGMISDIMPGDFLAAALRGDEAITVVDNGQATVYSSGSGTSDTSPSTSGGGDIDAVQPSPSGQMSPSSGSDASPEAGTSTATGTEFTVTTDNLKVRNGPGTTYDILGQLSMGTPLTGTVTDGWLKFTYNNKTAYCMASYLKASTGGSSTASSPSPSGSSTTGTEKTYKVTEADLKVRSGPGTTYDVLGKLALNDKVTGVVTNGWLKFTYNNKTGYCSADYLTLAN